MGEPRIASKSNTSALRIDGSSIAFAGRFCPFPMAICGTPKMRPIFFGNHCTSPRILSQCKAVIEHVFYVKSFCNVKLPDLKWSVSELPRRRLGCR